MGSVDGLPPTVANLAVNYGTGAIDVGQVEATDKVYIYAASTRRDSGPTLVANGVGPGNYALDLSSFLQALIEIFQAAVRVWAVWTTDDVNFSAPSNGVATGLTLGRPVVFSNVSIAATGELSLTIAGLTDPNDVFTVVALIDVGGGTLLNVIVGQFKGNGNHTAVLVPGFVFGLDPNESHEFQVIYDYADGYYVELFSYAFRYDPPPAPAKPYCVPRQAPGLEERPE